MIDTLRSKVIRLAHQRADMRPSLLPILTKNASLSWSQGGHTSFSVEVRDGIKADKPGPTGRRVQLYGTWSSLVVLGANSPRRTSGSWTATYQVRLAEDVAQITFVKADNEIKIPLEAMLVSKNDEINHHIKARLADPSTSDKPPIPSNLPRNADQWSLYSQKGAGQVARALTKRLVTALKMLGRHVNTSQKPAARKKAVMVVVKRMRDAMDQYLDFGAADGESYEIATNFMERYLEELLDVRRGYMFSAYPEVAQALD